MTNHLENKRLKNNYSCVNFTSVHAQLSRIWRLFIFSYNLIAIVWSMNNSMKHCTKHGLKIVTLSHRTCLSAYQRYSLCIVCLDRLADEWNWCDVTEGSLCWCCYLNFLSFISHIPEIKKKISDSFQEKIFASYSTFSFQSILTSSLILKTYINNLQKKSTILMGSMLSA